MFGLILAATLAAPPTNPFEAPKRPQACLPGQPCWQQPFVQRKPTGPLQQVTVYIMPPDPRSCDREMKIVRVEGDLGNYNSRVTLVVVPRPR